MIPLENGDDVALAAAKVRANASRFDWAGFEVWLRGQGDGIPALARRRPPDRLYRVVTDGEREGGGRVEVLGIVVGYKRAACGAPALCAVQVLGVDAGGGSAEAPLFVEASSLEDVTDRPLCL